MNIAYHPHRASAVGAQLRILHPFMGRCAQNSSHATLQEVHKPQAAKKTINKNHLTQRRRERRENL